MLDHMDGPQMVERPVRERVGKPVQIADEVGGAGGIEVDADRARKFPDTAADIERLRKQ